MDTYLSNLHFLLEVARLARWPTSRRHWTLVQRYLAELEERQVIVEEGQISSHQVLRHQESSPYQESPRREESPQHQPSPPPQSCPQNQPRHDHATNKDSDDFRRAISRIHTELDELQNRLSSSYSP